MPVVATILQPFDSAHRALPIIFGPRARGTLSPPLWELSTISFGARSFRPFFNFTNPQQRIRTLPSSQKVGHPYLPIFGLPTLDGLSDARSISLILASKNLFTGIHMMNEDGYFAFHLHNFQSLNLMPKIPQYFCSTMNQGSGISISTTSAAFYSSDSNFPNSVWLILKGSYETP